MSIPLSWVEKLFANMAMMYGNRMDKVWSGMDKQQVVAFWHMKMGDLGRDEFVHGVRSLDGAEYPPSLPQFLKMCRPGVDVVSAYYEAVKGLQDRRAGRKGEWSHPAVFWAAASMAFDLLNMSQPQVEKRWRSALEGQLRKTSWPDVPDVAPALPEPVVDREKGRAAAEAALERVGASGAVRKVKFSRGNGDWIVNNLERMGKGWNPLPGVRKCIMDGAGALGIAVPEGVLHEARSKNL